ncbi:MAG: redoxin domain-containing protein [Mycoplasmataceae bacterium]|nr:redoxin domain-containing protein [Mycoplasmataceae bacterium]
MKKNIIIIVISVLIAALGIGIFVYSISIPQKNLQEQENVNTDISKEQEIVEEEISKTKDIEGVTYNESTLYKSDRSEVKISDYKDKPIMLLFFNKENEDSIEVLKKVEELYKNYEGKIEFFMINTAEKIEEDLSNEYTLEIYYDFAKETAKKYNVTEVPSMIYINEFNEVFNAKAGFTTTDALEANLDILSNNI